MTEKSATRLDASILRIKAATRDVVKACGGVERAASIAGVGKSQVSRWQSATDEDMIPIRSVLDLQNECGLSSITDVLSNLGSTVRESEPVCQRMTMAQHSEIVAQLAGALAQIAAAMSDGKITPAEAASLDKVFSDLMRAIEGLRDTYADMRAGG